MQGPPPHGMGQNAPPPVRPVKTLFVFLKLLLLLLKCEMK